MGHKLWNRARWKAAVGLMVYCIVGVTVVGWLVLAVQHSIETHGHEPSPYEVEAELGEHIP